MDDNCPFCGAEHWDKGEYNCRTIQQHLPIQEWIRSTLCYETEITRLKSLVREMGRMLTDFETFVAAKYNLGDLINRPEVRAILEEK